MDRVRKIREGKRGESLFTTRSTNRFGSFPDKKCVQFPEKISREPRKSKETFERESTKRLFLSLSLSVFWESDSTEIIGKQLFLTGQKIECVHFFPPSFSSEIARRETRGIFREFRIETILSFINRTPFPQLCSHPVKPFPPLPFKS